MHLFSEWVYAMVILLKVKLNILKHILKVQTQKGFKILDCRKFHIKISPLHLYYYITPIWICISKLLFIELNTNLP